MNEIFIYGEPIDPRVDIVSYGEYKKVNIKF